MVSSPGEPYRQCPSYTSYLIEQQKTARLASLGLPERFRGVSVAGYRIDGSRGRQTAQRAIVDYVRRWEPGKPEGLYLFGPPGTGKTHLACAALRAIVSRHEVSGLFLSLPALTQEIQARIALSEPWHGLLKPALSVELLVLDELGAQKTSEHREDFLYWLLNERYGALLSTLITSELPLDRLADKVPGRLVSRLREVCREVGLEGVPDWRRTSLSATPERA